MHKITEKDHAPLKQQLLDECKNIQKKAIDSSKTAMDETQQALNEYGPNKDRYDSFRDQLIGKRDMFASQYQKALTECSILKKIIIAEVVKLAYTQRSGRCSLTGLWVRLPPSAFFLILI